jgi:hypothetical protein
VIVNAGDRGESVCLLVRDPDGYPRWVSLENMNTSTNIAILAHAGAKNASVSNITQIDIIATISGAIGADSKLIIYGGA